MIESCEPILRLTGIIVCSRDLESKSEKTAPRRYMRISGIKHELESIS